MKSRKVKSRFQWVGRRVVTPLRIVITCAAITGLSACNTVEGVGEDVERAGEAVQDATR
ncbi:entericidin A/B family lipoprotein [Congregibacter litoralis]|uniref:Putative small secreted protein n=1 Tax=Congregibacter litoralis KT71 TaxID=314285 RepID=V7HSZ3_9GAMM|nr:entericidin A/B family lipoprotein [Congregibacter litoralis]ESZ89351.1 putative small secreted protein [Congregibacter litoralis KT71]